MRRSFIIGFLGAGSKMVTPIDRSVRKEIEIIYPNGVVLKVESDLGLLSQLIRLY